VRGAFPGPVRRFLLVAVLALAIAWVTPDAASAALTATHIRIGDHPAFVRVVVDFTGGTLHRNDVESPDPQPFDCRAASAYWYHGECASRDRGAGHRPDRAALGRDRASALGEEAPLQVPGAQRPALAGTARRRPLEVAAATSAAEVPTASQGGCLSIENSDALPGRVRADGSENDLFEHMFQMNVRNQKGRVVGTRPVTASAGHWHRRCRSTSGSRRRARSRSSTSRSRMAPSSASPSCGRL
jgi:hypothetical protein